MEPAEGTIFNPYLRDPDIRQREEFLLLALFVAGKSAKVQQRKLHWFLDRISFYKIPSNKEFFTPFDILHYMQDETIEGFLRFCGVGQYARLTRAISWLVRNEELDLETCTRDDLVACPGLGMKTASFFLMNTRPVMDVACLDTHILKWLRDECNYKDVPMTTPTSKKQYLKWEEVFLSEAEKRRSSPRELDFEIWKKYEQKQQDTYYDSRYVSTNAEPPVIE